MVRIKHRVAEVGEVNAVRKFLHQQVRGVGIQAAQGTGAEREPAVHGGHFPDHPAHVLLITHDAGQPEDGPGRIVRMDGHADARFLADGHDLVEKVVQVLPQAGVVDALIAFEHVLELLRRQVVHRAGKPQQDGIRQRTAALPVQGLEEAARPVQGLRGIVPFRPGALQNEQVEGSHTGGIIFQHAAAVFHRKSQIGARPVQNGHEVVADHLHPGPGEVAEALLVHFQVMLPVSGTRLDILMDGDAFRHHPVHALLLDHPAPFRHGFFRPEVSALHFMQGRHDSGSARLADVPQRNRVPRTVPSPAFNHNRIR